MTYRPFPRPLRTPARGPAPSGRRRGAAAVATASAALALAAVLPPASASASPADATPTAEARRSPEGLRKALERVVAEERLPGALASTLDREGRTRTHTAGIGDLRTGAKVPADGQVRVGSNTKTFTATVVLQLVGEGRVELDAPVDRYLPDLLRGDGIDGRVITVRQLLQHTSGLPNYTDQLVEAVLGKGRHTYYQPRDLIDLALARKARFAPGTDWEYSNTNCVVAGRLVEKVTGRPFAEQVRRRVIDRIGLRHTYFPAVGEERLREAHPRGYQVPEPGAPLEDITEVDPSWGWSAGQLVSTPGDLNRFFSALLGGRLLEPAQLARMRTAVEVDGPGWLPGTRYGLGLTSAPLSCGGLQWGHGGNIPGYHSFPGATDDGRAATVVVTVNRPPAPDSFDRADALIDAALCGR
ncbi:serine hydrolase [Streptomyces lavendulae subsp. lavendulae]|uniref:serine hydrolase domain-containing protein n=1 Tax=Streptomyces lavendulae TaxID=1914 RepID=UPI0024A45E68|nr:serine hydrolase domain-containing protein [Streptomyces lavendulae]GLV85211.1 serine hydrolase [Streptomyces lavendulae subsp. lavendulae]